MNLRLKETMSHYLLVAWHDEKLSSAYHRMKREGVRHLPVLDMQGQLVGIISDRDFQRAMWPGTGIDAHGYPEGPVFKPESRVSDYMSSPV